jgi:isocitrate dehydrogenase
LNGDFISDAAAAMVGWLWLAPWANINYETWRAIFEATHWTAPDIMWQNKANPISLILSAKMMLEHLGWTQAAALVEMTVAEQLKSLRYTWDLYNQIRERDRYAKLQPVTWKIYSVLSWVSNKLHLWITPMEKAVVLWTKEMTQEMVQRILLAA